MTTPNFEGLFERLWLAELEAGPDPLMDAPKAPKIQNSSGGSRWAFMQVNPTTLTHMRPLAEAFRDIDAFGVQEAMRAPNAVDEACASLNAAGLHAIVNAARTTSAGGLCRHGCAFKVGLGHLKASIVGSRAS